MDEIEEYTDKEIEQYRYTLAIRFVNHWRRQMYRAIEDVIERRGIVYEVALGYGAPASFHPAYTSPALFAHELYRKYQGEPMQIAE